MEHSLKIILDKINKDTTKQVTQSEQDSANAVSPIKGTGLAPTVNRFGVASAKSILATSKNLVPLTTQAASNTTKKQITVTVDFKTLTLNAIAKKYGVSVESIRKANNLLTDDLTLGQILIITF